MEDLNNNTEVRTDIEKVVEYGPIVVSRVWENTHQKEDTLTAELKQVVTVTSKYPSKRISNEFEDNLFTADAFGFKPHDYVHKEKRVAWTLVPLGSTVESVQKMVDAVKDTARCYRVIGNRPTLTSGQKHAIATGMRTLPEIAMNQIVKFSDDHPDTPGQIILYDGKVQYRKIYFSMGIKDEDGNLIAPKEDIDRRGKEDEYIPEEIAAEISAFTDEQVVE